MPERSNARMFDELARHYDWTTAALSFGLDTYWHNLLIRSLTRTSPTALRVLDLATGTGLLLPMLHRAGLGRERLTGLDASPGMLARARKRLARHQLEECVELLQGDAAALPFPEASFDGVTMAFGLRNLTRLQDSLTEIHRVLRPGGQALFIELAQPQDGPARWAHGLYLRHLMPLAGGLVTRDWAAYRYLRDSILQFPSREQLTPLFQTAGFSAISWTNHTFGAAVAYQANK